MYVLWANFLRNGLYGIYNKPTLILFRVVYLTVWQTFWELHVISVMWWEFVGEGFCIVIVGVAMHDRTCVWFLSMIYQSSFPCSTPSSWREVNAFARWGEVVMVTHVCVGAPASSTPWRKVNAFVKWGEVAMMMLPYFVTPKGGECLHKVGWGSDVDTCLFWCAPQVNSFVEWCEVAMVTHNGGATLDLCSELTTQFVFVNTS